MEGQQKRPGCVWLIAVFTFVTCGFVIFSFYAIRSGMVPLPAGTSDVDRDMLLHTSSVEAALTALTVGFNLLGAVYLLLLNRKALLYFLVAFFANLGSTIWEVSQRGYSVILGGERLVSVAIGYLVAVIIIVYAANLMKRGVLK